MAKLPILMYHKVSETLSEGLTISEKNLEAQFQFLSENEYETYFLSDLYKLKRLPSKKSVVITFDDGYVSQLQYAVPLLQKYKLKAIFFIPLLYIGMEDSWNDETHPLMSLEQLKSLDTSIIELAYHSFAHQKFDSLSLSEIKKDTEMALKAVSENSLHFSLGLAYPFGKYPREKEAKSKFFNLLKKENFKYGLRIGNRLNTFPFKNPFEIQRIDVKGEFSLKKFKWKLRFGKIF